MDAIAISLLHNSMLTSENGLVQYNNAICWKAPAPERWKLRAKISNRVPFRNLLPNRVPFVIIYLGGLFFYYKVVPLKALPAT